MTDHFPYPLLTKQEIIDSMNRLAGSRMPFLFVIDFKAEKGYVIKENELNNRFVKFQRQEQIAKNQDISHQNREPRQIDWKILPPSLDEYKMKFEFVQEQIQKGNSFLTNLTQSTDIQTNLSLNDLFQIGSAKYKLWLKGKFVVFSPETFIQIRDGVISSFPMKGTINASLPNAEKIILNDPKERAEHATIVDLIRNDLSQVAEQVEVKRYRYVDKLQTNKGELLQISSEICGQLSENYREKLGDILFLLLPAGSVSGAPKAKTLEIISKAEKYERGFYTGICGWFDGENLDSAVMIRFIEQNGDKLMFKSGGGITSKSELLKEYEELIQKVYVPIC